MNIYIEFLRRHVDKEDHRIVTSRFSKCGITLFDAAVDRLCLDRTGVDKYFLIAPRRTGEARGGDTAGKMKLMQLSRQRNLLL